ncbi:adenylate cyclase associated N terminal-domain-containing protein [Chiua virens]|nr:adenylate cyclase associated N terminal-domain-containing protein [Chiua virens]
MSTQNHSSVYTLATIVKRLEAVASRFEDLEDTRREIRRQSTSTVTSFADTVAAPPPPPPPAPPTIVVEPVIAIPPSVQAFDAIVVEARLKPLIELTAAFTPQVLIDQMELFARAIYVLRDLLLKAAACKKPDQKAFEELLSPLQAAIIAVTKAKEAARKEREWFNHLTVVAEGVVCVGWVAVEPKPVQSITDIKDSTTYYSNRILKEFRDKDVRHTEWVRAFIAIMDDMKRYVLENHPTGLVWNANGTNLSEYLPPSSPGASAPAPAPAPAPPPPPPPPPPPSAPPAAAPAAGSVAAVFAELNRGEDVTKGLRKVDKSEMTHKNPALRASNVVPAGISPGAKKPTKPAKPAALMGKKPSKFALEGNKWLIEYQEDQPALEVTDVEINQTVNLFGCKNTTVVVKGKVNAVTLINCTKTSVLVESVISSVSITKSPSFQIQITGTAPTIQVDSTDSGQIYLSKVCLGVEITTAKCSAINVSLPVEGEEDGIFQEQAVPEMLKSVVKDGKLVTSVVEHPDYVNVHVRSPFSFYQARKALDFQRFDMDSIGWRAHRRAQKDDRYYQTQDRRGLDGKYVPVEEVGPLPDGSLVGGPPFPLPQGPSFSQPAPPTPPPKEFSSSPPQYQQPSASQPSHVRPSTSTSISRTDAAYLLSLPAADRSRLQRIPRMEPHLQLMVGPLLRYDTVDENGLWNGAVLIVTADGGSHYDPHPVLTYQWDPEERTEQRAGCRHGRSSFDLGPHPADPHSTAMSPPPTTQAPPEKFGYGDYKSKTGGIGDQTQRVTGQEIYVYAGNGTFTFWRFRIQIQLGNTELRIKYSINNSMQLSFYVPAINQNMRWASYSCNGFSAGVNQEEFKGPGYRSGYDPMWFDLLKEHAKKPFHVLVGGGDQLYCDALTREPEMQDWIRQTNSSTKLAYPVSSEMAACIDRFFFHHYCASFRNGAFARANSSIPMLNMCDDHDIIDGFGSLFLAIGTRAYFYYLLFQSFINPHIDGLDDRRGASSFQILDPRCPGTVCWIAIALVPCLPGSECTNPDAGLSVSPKLPWFCLGLIPTRAERTKEKVCSDEEYRRLGELQLMAVNRSANLVLPGIPIAYPRMVFLETALDSKLNPLTALGRTTTVLSGFVNKFNAEPELLDDLNDHWTAKPHKKERNWLIQQLQGISRMKRIRITFLSGDVHVAAVGVLKTLSRQNGGKSGKYLDLPPATDHRYMLSIVTSAIVNTPPPLPVIAMVSTLATKTHKTLHHADTDEVMMPLFTHEPDGTPRVKNKYIMGRRNWCATWWDQSSGELVFDIRVEKGKGLGESVGYLVRTPPPQWVAGS